jgi:hypothetical protein
MMTLWFCNDFSVGCISACTISRLCFFAKDHFLPWEDRLWMLTFCPKCIIMCYIKCFEMIPKILERLKSILDYLFQPESDLDAILLFNQNSSIPTDFSLNLMSFALRCYEIILNNSGDIFRALLLLREFV